MTKEFITSDLHFYHSNIIKFEPATRQWNTMVEMNSALLAAINKLPANSTLYHLGDFCFGGKDKVRDILSKIRADIKLVFILGNHDYPHRKLYIEHGAVVEHYKELKWNAKKICMFHYPMHEWNCAHHGALHFYGHVHGNFQAPGKCIDVGWDKHGRILTLDEAAQMADDRPKVTVVH